MQINLLKVIHLNKTHATAYLCIYAHYEHSKAINANNKRFFCRF